MANPEHLEKLKEGVAAWNSWREQNAAAKPDLGKADLSGAQLWGVNFSNANLRGANLQTVDLLGANLQEANFLDANLFKASLCGASVQRAYFENANLQGADLSGLDLSGVNFFMANLQGADFWSSSLSGAFLSSAKLQGAKLSQARLDGANLRHADLGGANLSMADLSNADLTGVRGLTLDDTRIVHARFSPRANDQWSVLRREYTGPSMILNLILVLLFFAPLAAKGVGLWGVSQIQAPLIQALNQLEGTTITVGCTDPDISAISGTVNGKEFRVPCRSIPMWKLLLGFGGPYGRLMPMLTALLLVYQVVRFFLTRQISLMRDAEERSGISPPLRDGLFAYPNLYRAHAVLRGVFLIGVFAFILRAWEFLVLTDVIQRG